MLNEHLAQAEMDLADVERAMNDFFHTFIANGVDSWHPNSVFD